MSIKEVNTTLLKDLEAIIGNDTTFSLQLKKIGQFLFGRRFVGVYPSDKLPYLRHSQMCIANLDASDLPGSHWIAMVKNGRDTYFYDSFGRKATKIMPTITKEGGAIKEDLTRTAEQKTTENDCGQRSMTWLIIYDVYGPKEALKI